jgi:hypothetical protein
VRHHSVQIRLAGGQQAAPLLSQLARSPGALYDERAALQLAQVVAPAVHVAQDGLAPPDLGGETGNILAPGQLTPPKSLISR